MIDLSPFDETELGALSQEIAKERERRNLLANAESRQEQLQVEVLHARDGFSEAGDPFPWVEPTGPETSYPLGWAVTEEGTAYRSLVKSNSHKPTPNSKFWEVIEPIEETE